MPIVAKVLRRLGNAVEWAWPDALWHHVTLSCGSQTHSFMDIVQLEHSYVVAVKYSDPVRAYLCFFNVVVLCTTEPP